MTEVKYGFGNRLKVGPWVVWAQYDPLIESPKEALSQKAIKSWESLMSGKIEYYLSVPSFDYSLEGNNDDCPESFLVVMDSFSKDTRPLAWKHTDLKIQSTLPLLGHNMKKVNDSTEKYVLAKVTLQLENL